MYAYQTFTDVIITKFNEVAASPADPIINSIDFGEWSTGFNCSIPTLGSNGETLNPQKMFYTVWVEKDGQQAPYVFKADMYYGVEEDMTEAPFSFNYGSWDGSHNIYFQDGVEECSTWTKVGIQSRVILISLLLSVDSIILEPSGVTVSSLPVPFSVSIRE